MKKSYSQTISLIFDLLKEAQTQRDHLNGKVGEESEWVVFERNVALYAVNSLRNERGLSLIDDDLIIQVETFACGHFDYTMKFAIGCANLVFDRPINPVESGGV